VNDCRNQSKGDDTLAYVYGKSLKEISGRGIGT